MRSDDFFYEPRISNNIELCSFILSTCKITLIIFIFVINDKNLGFDRNGK